MSESLILAHSQGRLECFSLFFVARKIKYVCRDLVSIYMPAIPVVTKQSVTTKIQPRQSVTTKIQPCQSVPTKTQPQQSATTKIQHQHNVTTKIQPRQCDSTKTQSVSTKTQTQQSAPTKIQRQQSEITKIQLRQSVTTKIQPHQSVPAKTQPQQSETTKIQHQHSVATKIQPRQSESTKTQSVSTKTQTQQSATTKFQRQQSVTTKIQTRLSESTKTQSVSTKTQTQQSAPTKIQRQQSVTTKIQTRQSVSTKTQSVPTKIQRQQSVPTKIQSKHSLSDINTVKHVMDELLISVTRDIEQRDKLIPKLYGGGAENIVYMTSDKVLDTKLVREIIENPDKNKVMFTPPIQPKAGEVYVFSTGGNPEKLNDWRSDKYIWINRGGHGIPKNSKSLWKLWYKISLHASDRQGDSGFTRSAYIFKDKLDWPYVVIHYRGDESVFVPRPHGLSVINTRPHERTCPSILSAMKPKVLQNSCGKVYAENVTSGQTNAVHQGILNARDKKQVKNMATAQRNKYRVSHDEIFGSLQIAHHVNDFVKLLSIYPDIRVVLGSKDILSELNRVLAVKSDEPALLSYDTTFNVGDFFV